MVPDLRIAIIGAGFAGIGAAVRLAQAGFRDVVILERAGDVGGVWRDNVYPGCACDVQSHLYSLSFALNPTWSRSFSPQPEILAYLKRVAVEHGVREKIRFGHDVRGARWVDGAWHIDVQTSAGAEELVFDAIVGAQGGLSEPATPAIPGLSTFAGKVMHSARWDTQYDLRGKKVAVIGTGASAIQIVPAIQPLVDELVLFQRTPPWVFPRRDEAISENARRWFARVPALQWLVRAGIAALRELLLLAFLYPSAQRYMRKLATRYLERKIKDPVLRAKLTPSYAVGCKRILLSDNYLPALVKKNVHVVTEGIRAVGERSIVDNAGAEHAVDAIVLGTGFRVTDPPFAKHVVGKDGRTLAEVWNGSMKAHVGTTVHGFPSLFLLQGPNTGLGHTSVIQVIEIQIDHVVKALRHVARAGAAALEPTMAAQDRFVADVDRAMPRTVWSTGGCASWYIDATGRNSTIWPGSIRAFRRRIAFRAADYALIGPRDALRVLDTGGALSAAQSDARLIGAEQPASSPAPAASRGATAADGAAS